MLSARCGAVQYHRIEVALTAFRVLNNPAAVETVVGAAIPLLREPRLAQVLDRELVRLGWLRFWAERNDDCAVWGSAGQGLAFAP